MKQTLTKLIVLATIAGLLVWSAPGFIAQAATLTLVKDIMNRLIASQTTGITHKFILTTVGAVSGGAGINELQVTAPDADDATWCATAGTDLVAAGCTDETSTALPGTLTARCTVGTGGSSYDLIFIEGVNDLTATTKYCVDLSDGTTGKLGTPAAGSHTMTLDTNNGTADVDTGDFVVTLVADDTVVTSATVAASLSFAITGDLAIGFGTITNAASRWATDDELGNASATSAHTITAGTNSTGGYTITVKGATLTSTGTPADTITAMAAEAVLDTGEVEQFGLRITSAGGSGAVDADYDNTPADTYFYGANATTTDVIATSAGASATTTYSLFYAANISADTEAHTDYSASLIYVATGNF